MAGSGPEAAEPAGAAVGGRRVPLPLTVRSAGLVAACFRAPAGPVAELLRPAGLRPVRPVPGAALCVLGLVRYREGDLGSYDEFMVGFPAHRPTVPPGRPGRPGPPGRRRRAWWRPPGLHVHWLPVTGRFAEAAGRSVWGFPKTTADIRVLPGRGGAGRCVVAVRDAPVLSLEWSGGLPVPGPLVPALRMSAFTGPDSGPREVPWRLWPEGLRWRPGGARLVLGAHPAGRRLAALGLPSAALGTVLVDRFAMEVGAPVPLPVPAGARRPA